MVKFSLKFDDEKHTLTSTDGLPMDKVAELLAALFAVIKPDEISKCTLGQIRGNCYALDFYSENEKFETNFKVVHSKIEQHSESDLKHSENKYAKTLKSILGGKYYVQALDGEGKEIAKISTLTFEKEIEHYYATTTVNGIVSQLGGKDLQSKSHVLVSGQDYRIYVSTQQDLQLKPHYKTNNLSLRLCQKKSFKDGHIISASLLSFSVINEGRFIDKLNDLDVSELRFLNEIEGLSDIN